MKIYSLVILLCITPVYAMKEKESEPKNFSKSTLHNSLIISKLSSNGRLDHKEWCSIYTQAFNDYDNDPDSFNKLMSASAATLAVTAKNYLIQSGQRLNKTQ